MKALFLAALALVNSAASPPAPTAAPKPLSVEDCVRIALADSGRVEEAEGKVEEWMARLDEVSSSEYPKLSALGWVAPMYKVTREAGPITFGDSSIKTDYGSWGPYFHVQAILAQPIYTFGRIHAGKEAAGERVEVEKGRTQEVKNAIALEVRRFYYLYLYAETLKPVLDTVKQVLDDAQAKGKEQFEKGSGKVTSVDLAKLAYGASELDKFKVEADIGSALALSALKQTMGLPMDAPLTLAEDRLPDPPAKALPPLAELIRTASVDRPEMAELTHGASAAVSLEQAERLANAPTVFAAGQFSADYTAMRTNAKNPYLYDPYNQVSGGVAVGLQWDFDPAKAKARTEGAIAIQKQVEGLKKFAQTGIPMEVRKSHDDVIQAEKLHALSVDGSVHARKWMLFASSAYSAGTGEAKDVLEGLAAYLGSKRGVYDNLLAVHVSRSELLRATGSAFARPDLEP